MGVCDPQDMGHMGVLGWIGDKSPEKPLDLCKQFTGRDLITGFSIHPLGKMLRSVAIDLFPPQARYGRVNDLFSVIHFSGPPMLK